MLADLGFIRIASGTAGEFSHAVILNPHFAIRRLHAAKTAGLTAAAYNALVERAIAIGAEDMNVPLPEERQEEPAPGPRVRGGVRIPYGKRTGVEVVDTLTVIAHERFNELIEKAKEENGVTHRLKSLTIGEGVDVPASKPVMVTAPSLVEQMVLQAAAGAQATTAPLDASSVKDGVAMTPTSFQAPPAPPFKYAKPEEIGLAKTVLNVVLPQISKQVTSIKDLEDPKVVQRIAEAAMAAQKFDDGLFASVTPEQATAVTAEVCRQFVQRTIAIPMLTITPEQHVSFGFRRFDVDLKSWNYQPLSRELLIQILRTEQRTVISGDAGGETPSRLGGVFI